MNKAEQLLREIREKEYGNTLEDCIEWAIIEYFNQKEKDEVTQLMERLEKVSKDFYIKENKMEFTCIECKGKFYKHQFHTDERMCHECFEEDTKIEYTNNLIRDRVDPENYRKNLKTS